MTSTGRVPCRRAMRAPRGVLLAALSASVLLGGCSSDPTGGPIAPPNPPPPPPPPGPPIVLAVVPATDVQTAVAGQELPVPIGVIVTKGGAPLGGVPITWSTSSGQFSAAAPVTDSWGRATARWRLGDAAGLATASAFVSDQPAVTVRFTATAWERVAVEQVSSTIDQHGVVNDTFSIAVRVHGHGDPAPRAGIPVTWSAPGVIEPTASVTDADGLAHARWWPGTLAGSFQALVQVRGAPGMTLIHRVTLWAGPARQVVVTSAPDSVARNWTAPTTVRGMTLDAYGNAAANAPVEWFVTGTGLTLQDADSISADDATVGATLARTGEVGLAEVRARVVGHPISDAHTIRVVPNRYVIRLDPNTGFVSLMNGTTPAIDTIPVESLVHWWLQPFDYELHVIDILGGTGVSGGGPFPYGNPSLVWTEFDTVGTYRYRDLETGFAGTLVVVP